MLKGEGSLASNCFFWRWGWVAAWVLLIFIHCTHLDHFPGFHFDEAWVANLSHRIANESGFWPFQAQSPYANSISYYGVAWVYKVFGTSVWSFRLTGVIYSLLGLALFQMALSRKYRPQALYFPWIILASMGLWLNPRFSIELNTFHVFCFGLIAWGLTLKAEVKRLTLFAVGIVAGTISHLLFLAPALALLGTRMSESTPLSRLEKLFVAGLSGCFIPYAFYLSWVVPERDKVFLMLGGAFAVLIWSLFFSHFRFGLLSRFQKIFEFLSLPLLAICLFFLEGHWSLSIYTSELQLGFAMGIRILLIGLVYFKFKAHTPEHLNRFSCFLLLATATLMLKPAPRYFELAMLTFCVVLCFSFIRVSRVWLFLAVFSSLWGFWFSGISKFSLKNYREREIRFGPLKDHSKDFWPLGLYFSKSIERRCELREAFSGDHRLATVLEFMKWERLDSTKCLENSSAKKLQVERTPEGKLTLSP
jgi:hypothetical protein